MKPERRDIVIAAVALAIVGCCGFSISPIAQGKGSYFGLCNIIMPALVSLGGIAASVLMTLFFALKYCSGHLLITKGLPTLAAVYSAQAVKPSYVTLLLNIILPIGIATAFIMHPIGGVAWTYSLFWLIPISCEIIRRCGMHSLFIRLLAATFVAHGVGSVIWLYSTPTTPATWLTLLSVVPAERLIFASGASLAALLFTTVKHLVIKKNCINPSNIA
jgi:hypothetical protein